MPPRDVRRAAGVGAIITIASIFFSIFPVWVWLQIDPVIRLQDIYISCIVLPALIAPTCSFFILRAQIRAERLAKENDRLANHDELTGLPNRRAFFARAGELLAAAPIAARTFSPAPSLTSTISSASTTRMATIRATRCCRRWPPR
jgi:predicted signal transduction protein with EAL and GGDEF domain